METEIEISIGLTGLPVFALRVRAAVTGRTVAVRESQGGHARAAVAARPERLAAARVRVRPAIGAGPQARGDPVAVAPRGRRPVGRSRRRVRAPAVVARTAPAHGTGGPPPVEAHDDDRDQRRRHRDRPPLHVARRPSAATVRHRHRQQPNLA